MDSRLTIVSELNEVGSQCLVVTSTDRAIDVDQFELVA